MKINKGMKINVKFGCETGPVMKYLKLSLLVIGHLVALPMAVVILILGLMQFFLKLSMDSLLDWFRDVTDAEITVTKD